MHSEIPNSESFYSKWAIISHQHGTLRLLGSMEKCPCAPYPTVARLLRHIIAGIHRCPQVSACVGWYSHPLPTTLLRGNDQQEN